VVVNNLPVGEFRPQFAGVQQKRWIAAFIIGRVFTAQVNGGHEHASSFQSRPNVSKQVTLQIVEIADEIKGAGLDYESALLQVCNTRIDRYVAGASAGPGRFDSNFGRINRYHLPSPLGQKQSVTSCPASKIER